MEAKDTVMTGEQIDGLPGSPFAVVPGIPRAILEAQAETSFKAGRKEAVEWVIANALYIYPENKVWQAKLKEWRIVCVRCGAIRTDNVDSDICGSCGDDLRMEKEAHSGQANADTGTD